jgi:hypothetical protein
VPEAARPLASGLDQVSRHRTGLDAVVVPGLLLLLARDLLVRDPVRVVAWRLAHEPRLSHLPAWLLPLLPTPPAGLDRDPVALLLAGLAVGMAALYILGAVLGAGARARAAVLGVAALLLVVLPTGALIAIGVATERPYGQDGGVVQLPLALDKLLAGESPYGADYSDSILGKQSRVSRFWGPLGGNPILRHHAYLPGTHLLMLPAFVTSRALLGFFDPRLVTLLAMALAAVLATRLVRGGSERLTAAALVLVNPLVYWHQVFGANELLFVSLLLLAVHLAAIDRRFSAGAMLGLACSVKQLAWPFAPFLLAFLSGAPDLRGLLRRESWARLRGPAAAAAIVFVLVVAPIACLDPGAFYRDIVVYNVGLSGGDSYPLGGTPGIGIANLLLVSGRVEGLRDYFPFGVFYLLLVPLGLLLLRVQLRSRSAAMVLLTGSTALMAAVLFSRVPHPNYLVAAFILVPLSILAGAGSLDTAVVPLLLLSIAAELAELSPLRTLWQQGEGVGLWAGVPVLGRLSPRLAAQLTSDPLSLLGATLAAGLALAYLVAGTLRLSRRLRGALLISSILAVVVAPTLLVVRVGQVTGQPRAEYQWAVQAPADASRLARLESPYRTPPADEPTAREAWATSFRREPPRLLVPEPSAAPPGAALLLALLPVSDPRFLALGALAVLVLAAARLFPPEERLAAVGLAGLAPAVALDLTFGSGGVMVLAALVVALGRQRQGAAGGCGVLAGLAASLDHRALVVLPFLLLALPPGACRRRFVRAAAVVYALLVVPVVALGPGAFLQALLAPPSPGAGVGVVNLLLYRGTVPGPAAELCLVGAGASAAVLLWWRARKAPGAAPQLGAAALMLALVLLPEPGVDRFALPVVLVPLLAWPCLPTFQRATQRSDV